MKRAATRDGDHSRMDRNRIQRAKIWRTNELLDHLEPRLLLSGLVDVTANHGDAGSTGQNTGEVILNPTSIATATANTATTFGRTFDTTLDGQIYAQPLEVTNVNITRGSSQGLHDVIYVATMHDSLYAIDAESGAILWQDNFLQIGNPQVATINSPSPTAGVTTFPAVSGDNSLVNSSDVGPELGILATPAIDTTSNILYLDANSQELRSGAAPVSTFTTGTTDIHYVQRLWAINLSDGSVAIAPTNNPSPSIEPSTGGQIIADTILNPTGTNTVPSFSSYTGYKYVAGPWIKGTGNNNDTFNANGTVATTNNADGWAVNAADTSSVFAGTTPSAAGAIAFNGLLQMNRVATTLINGEIYLGFASHGDDGPYYGWLLGYSASTLANNAAFVTVPTFDNVKGSAGFTSVGGLWGAGATITTDGTYLYFAVGNGSFNPATTNFNATYVSTDSGPSGNHTVSLPRDSDYGDTVLKVALDLNATQANVNLANAAAGNPTPTGAYNPDGGYNVNGYGLKVVDFFTPSNVWELNLNDEDIGSSGVLLMPSTGAGSITAPNGDPILAFAGKEGRLYLTDADNLGGFNTQYITDGHQLADPKTNTSDASGNPAPYDNVLGEYYYAAATGFKDATTGLTVVANNQQYKGYDIPSYFNGEIYLGLGGGSTGTRYTPEIGFSVASLFFPTNVTKSNRTATYATQNFTTGNTTNSPLYGGRGTTATITSSSGNSSSNEIVWNTNVTQSSSDVLIAYDGNGNVLFSSNWSISGQSNNTSDSLTNGVSGATGIKFGIPTVANGLVYVGTGGGSGTGGHILGTLAGYGFLNPILHAPASPTATSTSPTAVHLTWTLTSGDQESEVLVQRSTDGTNFTTLAILGNGTTSFDDTTTVASTHYFYRVEEVYGAAANTKVSVNAQVTTQGLTLSSVVSRKTQGAGVLDIPVFLVGNPSLEPRLGGPTQLVFTFNENVTLPANFSLGLTSGTGSATVSGNVLTVNLSGVTNGQLLTVTLTNVDDPSGNPLNFSAQLRTLAGDSDASGKVDLIDLQAVANHWQQAASGPSEGDFDGNGKVDLIDLQAVANDWQATVSSGGGSGTAVAEVTAASANLSPATNSTAHNAPVIPPSNSPSSQAVDTEENDAWHHHFSRKPKFIFSKFSISI